MRRRIDGGRRSKRRCKGNMRRKGGERLLIVRL